MSTTFADWIGQKHRLPYTSWGDFLRLCQQSGELASVQSHTDLLQLVAKYKVDNGVSDARRAWYAYRAWVRGKGIPDPGART